MSDENNEDIFLDEWDMALTMENRTRQLWAEKHLEMLPSPGEQAQIKWYNNLHEAVENDFKRQMLPHAGTDLTPSSKKEPFSKEYQSRLTAALREPGVSIIGANFVYGNASVRVPLSYCDPDDHNKLQVCFLALFPTEENASLSTIENFMCLKASCVAARVKEDGFVVLPPKVMSPALGVSGIYNQLTRKWASGDKAMMDAVKKANDDLSDPFVPPVTGRFYERLDAELLTAKELPRYIIANKSVMFGFDVLQREVDAMSHVGLGELFSEY